MNRLETVAGISVVVLAAAGLGHKYMSLRELAQTPDPVKSLRPEAVPAAPPAATIDSTVRAFLADVANATDADRAVHLGQLVAAMDGPTLEEDDLDPDTAESLAKAVVTIVEKNPDDSPESAELRRRAVGLLASRVSSPSSKAYILKVMTDGPQDLREEAVARVGSPRGVRGPSVYAAVRDLGEKGLIPDALLPQALRRTGGLKARETLTALMKSTDSAKLIGGCAVALQDYRDPDALGGVLERLEQVGRLDSNAKLPWISAALLEQHLKTADKAQFRRGMVVMAARPGLARIDLLAKGLDSPDAETRRLAAAAIKRAVVAKTIDARRGETLLAGRLQTETEPVLKAELTGGLERVHALVAAEPTTQQ